jgi:hypothetical protein
MPRIVNGRGTAEYPSTGALLKGTDPRSAKVWCSGTLVGCNKFLTAAHCIAKEPSPQKYKVFFQNAGFFDVAEILWPKEQYSFPNADVAVLSLARPVEGLLPERVNRAAKPLDGTEGTIVGFGRTGGSNEDYGIKREGFIQTASCTGNNSNTTLICWNFDVEVQAGSQRSNTCNADSGGPLFIDETQGGRRFRVAAGVTSGGTEEDCLIGDHSYDTNLYHYRQWIESTSIGPSDLQACGLGPVIDIDRHVLATTERLNEQKTEVSHTFEVESSVSQLMVAMNGGDNGKGWNDFDLYLIPGANGDISRAVCSENGSGQFGFCQITKPDPGPWTVVVKRKSGQGLVQIVVTRLP